MQYRGKGGRATDGERAWQVEAKERVGSPPGYGPPPDPLKAIEPTPLLERVNDAFGTWLLVCMALWGLAFLGLFAIGVLRVMFEFAFG